MLRTKIEILARYGFDCAEEIGGNAVKGCENIRIRGKTSINRIWVRKSSSTFGRIKTEKRVINKEDCYAWTYCWIKQKGNCLIIEK